jgi:hypothetical protein
MSYKICENSLNIQNVNSNGNLTTSQKKQRNQAD